MIVPIIAFVLFVFGCKIFIKFVQDSEYFI